MKILQLISSYGFFGAENVALELSRELDSRNIENFIGVFENSQNPHTEIAHEAKGNNLKCNIFPCNGKIDVGTLYSIKKFIKSNNIDILHTHGYKSNTYGFIIARLLKKPIVSTCHNWIADDFKTKSYYRLDKFILPRFDRIIAVSEDIEGELLRNKVKEAKISLIYNGINISKFSHNNGNLRSEFNIGDKTKVVGTVARFTAEKGLVNLLHAAKEVSDSFPDTIFMFVGDGPLRNELEKRSVELGIGKKVIFTGQRSDMLEIYCTMDIFVLPSLKEGLPMVLLEAMAAEKPVIATKVGAISGVIEDRKEGLLISPGDIDELGETMICLLEDDKFSKDLSQNAYRKVVQKFSSEAMCGEYLEVYQEMLLNRSGKAGKKTFSREGTRRKGT